MKTFSRLRDQEGSEVERLLLGSAEGDAPLPAARVKVLAALGVAGTAAGAAGTAHAASAVVVGSAGGKAVGSATTITLAKWVLAGAVAGAATTGGLVVATTPGVFGGRTDAPIEAQAHAVSPSRSTPPVKGAAERLTAPPVPADTAASSHAATEASAPRARASVNDEPPASLAPAPQGTAFPVANADTVAEEVAALDRARGALASGDARGALARLDAYANRYPTGTLAPEAAVLRVRALVHLGRTRDARAAVDAFVRAHPGSPQASRLRALVVD
jgi:outer membrane lipoprotein YfiO